MSFQTDDLAMLVLGILDDKPPDEDHPRLRNGLHCRWIFAPERGFPWHGFYLFRRESQPRRPLCLSPFLGGLRPGSSRGTGLETRLGLLSSTRRLIFTDEFSPSGTVGVDLDQGAPLRFDLTPGVQVRRVDVRVGLRSEGPRTVRTCADFRREPLGATMGGRETKGAVFQTEIPPVSPPLIHTLIEQWNGTPAGLQTSRQLEIDLPCPATRIDLLLTNRGELTIAAFEGDGARADIRQFQPLALQTGTVTLTGKALARVVLASSTVDPALLHEICWECPAGGTAEEGAEIEIRVLAGTSVASRALARGNAGEAVAVTLQGNELTAVEIGPGKGALLDLCVWPTRQGETWGWGEVPGFRYPLCLPVEQKDYPCLGKPATFAAARELALSRIIYGEPARWEDAFPDLHGQLEILVKGGPGGGPMANRVIPTLLGDPLGPAPDSEPFRLENQRCLDLLLLASLHPAIAQMLGLYFLDSSAEPGIPYDYLLLADPTGVLGGSASTALDWLAFQPDANAVDAWLVLGKTVAPAPPLPPPGKARVYALPGATTRAQDGKLNDAQTNVGLWWEAPPDPSAGATEETNIPVLYYPRRAFLGIKEPGEEPAEVPPDDAYKPLRPDPEDGSDSSAVVLAEPAAPPPPLTPGETRRSPEWPPASVPLRVIDTGLAEGWYSYRVLGQDLFGRRSMLGPPAEWYQWDPPAGQELPWYYRKDAPGHRPIHSFAVALLDKIPPPNPTGLEAAALDPLDRWVLRDSPYEKWRDRNPDVVGLRVRWKWTLSQMNQAPDTREFRIYYISGRLNELPGEIGLDHLRQPANWAKRLAVVLYADAVEEGIEPSRDPENRPLDAETFKNAGVTVAGGIAHFPPDVDLSGLQPWLDHLYLASDTARPGKTYRIEEVDPKFHTVTLDGEPDLGGNSSPWTIGRPVRIYETFLPAPDLKEGEPFRPTLERSTVFAQIGVSAADDKIHTGDDPKWGASPLGNRFGNEGRVSPPAAIYRVLQTPPEPPELADYPGGRLWATRADYHSRSFFSFRWKPRPHLKTHVLRALDDSLFQRDWLIRETREALDPEKHQDLFPDGWDLATRQAAVTELNKITSPAGYDSLSENTWKVLALLSGNEGAGDRKALKERDWEIRQTRNSGLVDVKSPDDYRTLSDSALRILAGLPGNEDAFTQITLQPLDDTDPEVQDRRLPDDAADYTPKPTVRAYMDTLPGRATNRYFYRAAFVDGAHNRSGLSPSTPPVYLPKVEPPPAPVITGIFGGERTITIRWVLDRGPALRELHVYRAHTRRDAEDVRRMALVHLMTSSEAGEPLADHWTDTSVEPLQLYCYRVVVIDAEVNASPPSRVASAQAYDQRPPMPLSWISAEWTSDGKSVQMAWSSPAEPLEVMVLRRMAGGWRPVSTWLPATVMQHMDETAINEIENRYRLKVRNAQGLVNVLYEEIGVASFEL